VRIWILISLTYRLSLHLSFNWQMRKKPVFALLHEGLGWLTGGLLCVGDLYDIVVSVEFQAPGIGK